MRTSTWRHLLGAPAGVLVVGATAIACQSSAPATVHAVDNGPSETTSRTTTPSVTTYFPQYGASGRRAYEPRRLNPSVDGSLYLTRVHWTVWNNRHAVGTGIAHVNDCTPSCAMGHDATHRVTVRLSHPRRLCKRRFFMTISVRGSRYHTYAHWPGVSCG